MKTTKQPLSALTQNPDNPRTISDENLDMLINSILEFPKMLEIRPIVTDGSERNLILGGNMRHRALTEIYNMAPALPDRIAGIRSVAAKSREEQKTLIDFWCQWLTAPYAYVTAADELTEEDKRALVIKDNVNAGYWDYDALGNFDENDLHDWGVTTWGGLKPFDATLPIMPTNSGTAPAPTGHTAPTAEQRERIIVVFPRDRQAEVEKLLRLPVQSKTSYRFSELSNVQDHESSI